MKFSFYLLAVVSPLLAFAEATWKQEANDAIELSEGETTLVRFVLDAAPCDPHFEVLATPDGRNTVWVAPDDHVWHYGLWFSWKKINGVNFWETDRETGRQKGRNEIVDPRIDSEPDRARASITYLELAYPQPDGPAALEDSVEIVIARPEGGHGPQIDWTITTTALEDTVLDRTPIPGEPDGKGWGGYAGFSWRGAEAFEAVQFLDANGRRNAAAHRATSQWVNVTGDLKGSPAGLLILPHPSNPRQPSSWYITRNTRLPFYFANPAILQAGPIKLRKGESFTHRYRVILHDGEWSAKECETAAAQYAANREA